MKTQARRMLCVVTLALCHKHSRNVAYLAWCSKVVLFVDFVWCRHLCIMRELNTLCL